jgi:hypothetical protein
MESNLLSMASEFSGLPMDALIGAPLNAAARANASMALTQTKFMLDTCFVMTPVPTVPEEKGKPAVYDPVTGKITTPETVAHPEVPAHNNYTPIMIVMELTRGVITDAQKAGPDLIDPATGKPIPNSGTPAVPTTVQYMTTTFNLPLLTIVPLNSLAVQTVDITFEMEVKSSFAEDTSESHTKDIQGSASLDAKIGWGPFSASIKASASYDQKDSTTHDTHYQKSNSAKYTVNVHAGQLPLPSGVNIIIQAFANSITPIEIKAT